MSAQPTEPSGAVVVNLVHRIEVRAASPDPSLPHSGRLLAYAVKVGGDFWSVVVRQDDGSVKAYPVADEAAARTELHRIAAGGAP